MRREAPAPQIGLVHLGLGAFFRAHGAVYIQDAGTPGWGILGVSLRSPDVRDTLARQDFLYHAVERGPDGDRVTLVNQLAGVLCAPKQPQAVRDALAAPNTKLVTLTVTEKGYCHSPSTGKLDLSHTDIQADLGGTPTSALGYLVDGFAARRAAGIPPFTVLSCDNIPHNGALLRGLVCDLAHAQDPDLAAWIDEHGRFPSSMVDRIVPATRPSDIEALAAQTGVTDHAPIFHEPFRQWVIEDRFVGGHRPEWERAGVQMVRDVAPFEAMKLRMLNGAHSALAYLAPGAGHHTVAQAVADPIFATYLSRMWDEEVIPTLTHRQHRVHHLRGVTAIWGSFGQTRAERIVHR
ncbi:MAG: mannitol dehydrogenase family protein, partial [Pseudomonadota bacterium]